MKDKLSKAFSHKIEVLGKTVPTALVALLLVGGGSAAVATVLATPISGSGTVSPGFQFQLDGVSGAASDADTTNNEFTVDMASGSSFGFALQKENLANDETEALVETVVLDADTDLQASTLERVNFWANQTTTEEDGSTVPQGTTVNYNLTWNQTGHMDDSENGDYLYATTTDVDSDESTEVLVCVANPELRDDGMTFGPSEHWNASYEVDTQTSFDADTIDVNSSIRTVYNPETQGLSDVVAECPQYAN